MKNEYKINIVKNKSATYMLPLLHGKLGLKFDEFLLNSYISFYDKDDTFCIMYKWSSHRDFLVYEKNLMDHPLYIGHADYGDKVVYRFNLTLPMKAERQLFIDGKYKDFSDEHKKAIFEYVDFMNYSNADRIKRIVTKGDELTSTPPNMDAETVSKNIEELKIKTDKFTDEQKFEVKNNPFK